MRPVDNIDVVHRCREYGNAPIGRGGLGESPVTKFAGQLGGDALDPMARTA